MVDQHSPTKVMRVLIVDDHPIVREGLSALMGLQSDFEVVGQADDVLSAVKLLETIPVDVAVIDVSLKTGSGLDLVRRIKAQYPEVRMLVSSMFDDSLYAERSLQAGALGYINKQEAGKNIIAAIRRVHAGKVYLSEPTQERLLQRSIGGVMAVPKTPIETLTERELQIFRLIGQGTATVNIAQELHLSVKTVETYRQRIKSKLNLDDAVKLAREAAQWVLENG